MESLSHSFSTAKDLHLRNMFSSPAWDFLDWLLAYYAMNRWLGNFAYPVRIGVDIFGFSFVLAVVVASLTIFYHSVKALLDNPIDSLRYE